VKFIKTHALNFVVLILCCGLLSCGKEASNPQSAQSDSYEGWQTFSEENYSIRYPADWKLKPGGPMGVKFIISAAQGEAMAENVNLASEEIPASMNLEDYVAANLEMMPTMLPNYKKIEGRKISTGIGETYKLIGAFDMKKAQIKNEQYYLIRNWKAYVLTFTSTQERFDRYQDIGEKIFDSFRFH
jgi:hypothetical protein